MLSHPANKVFEGCDCLHVPAEGTRGINKAGLCPRVSLSSSAQCLFIRQQSTLQLCFNTFGHQNVFLVCVRIVFTVCTWYVSLFEVAASEFVP